jgi:hypothetical protein
MLENLFGKKTFGEDEDNILAFTIMYNTANSIKSISALCASNPKKCRPHRKEICGKFVKLLGYKLDKKDDACKIYKELTEIKEKTRRASIKPNPGFINDVGLHGNSDLKEFIMRNGFKIENVIDSLDLRSSIAVMPTVYDY